MKKVLPFLLILVATFAFADTKITQLTNDASPDGADLVVTVDDVAGTPTTKKATIANVLVDGNIPDDITIDLSATATALAANPTDCSGGEYATAIDASGNLTCAAVSASPWETVGSDIYEDDGNVGIGTSAVNSLLDVGGGVASFIDGTNDILVADDIEIDDDLFVTDDVDIDGAVNIKGNVTLSGNSNSITIPNEGRLIQGGFVQWLQDNTSGDEIYHLWLKESAGASYSSALHISDTLGASANVSFADFPDPNIILVQLEGADSGDGTYLLIGTQLQSDTATQQYIDFVTGVTNWDGSQNATTTELAPIVRFGLDGSEAATGHSMTGGDVLFNQDIEVDGNIYADALAGSYGSGSAYVCVYDNGQLFASDSACP